MRRYLRLCLLVVGLFVITFTARYFILDGTNPTMLSKSGIAQAISKSLQTSQDGTYLPVAGKDYSVKSIIYLNNQQWAIVSILPVNNDSDPATIVLHLQGTTWVPTLGPGNGFAATALKGLPNDVITYLETHGAVVEGEQIK